MNRYVTIILTLFVFLVYTNSAQTQSKVLTEAAPACRWIFRYPSCTS